MILCAVLLPIFSSIDQINGQVDTINEMVSSHKAEFSDTVSTKILTHYDHYRTWERNHRDLDGDGR